jgi:hypothetical protein
VSVDGLRVVIAQPVVQTLVVGVVEPLLLERVLHVPVDFGEQQKIGRLRLHLGDGRGPELDAGPVELPAPRAQENVVREQHRHVAAHAVATPGD